MKDKRTNEVKRLIILKEVSNIQSMVKQCQNIIDKNNIKIKILFKVIKYILMAGIAFMLSAYMAAISTGNNMLFTIGYYIVLSSCLISTILLLFVRRYNRDNESYVHFCLNLLNIAKDKMNIITEISDEEGNNH